jgi:hypothetical protein
MHVESGTARVSFARPTRSEPTRVISGQGLVSPPAPGDAQDLIQLVYNGRDRPGNSNYSQYVHPSTAKAACTTNTSTIA